MDSKLTKITSFLFAIRIYHDSDWLRANITDSSPSIDTHERSRACVCVWRFCISDEANRFLAPITKVSIESWEKDVVFGKSHIDSYVFRYFQEHHRHTAHTDTLPQVHKFSQLIPSIWKHEISHFSANRLCKHRSLLVAASMNAVSQQWILFSIQAETHFHHILQSAVDSQFRTEVKWHVRLTFAVLSFSAPYCAAPFVHIVTQTRKQTNKTTILHLSFSTHITSVSEYVALLTFELLTEKSICIKNISNAFNVFTGLCAQRCCNALCVRASVISTNGKRWRYAIRTWHQINI